MRADSSPNVPLVSAASVRPTARELLVVPPSNQGATDTALQARTSSTRADPSSSPYYTHQHHQYHFPSEPSTPSHSIDPFQSIVTRDVSPIKQTTKKYKSAPAETSPNNDIHVVPPSPRDSRYTKAAHYSTSPQQQQPPPPPRHQNSEGLLSSAAPTRRRRSESPVHSSSTEFHTSSVVSSIADPSVVVPPATTTTPHTASLNNNTEATKHHHHSKRKKKKRTSKTKRVEETRQAASPAAAVAAAVKETTTHSNHYKETTTSKPYRTTRESKMSKPRLSQKAFSMFSVETPQPCSKSGMKFEELYKLKGVVRIVTQPYYTILYSTLTHAFSH